MTKWVDNVTVQIHTRLTESAYTKVNSRGKYSNYEVKLSMYGAIYVGNTQKKFYKIMDGPFSDAQHFFKNGHKPE